MSFVRDDGGAAADFTAALRAGGYGLPQPDVAGHGHAHGTNGVSTSVRTAMHGGHEIRIETTYAITIDGKPLEGGLEVLDNGAVHYHGLPQYALPSAIDMCKRVLDYFGTEPPAADELGCLVGEHGAHCEDGTCCVAGGAGGDGGTHQHSGDHADHGAHSDHAGHNHPAPDPAPVPAPAPVVPEQPAAPHDHDHEHGHEHAEGHK